MAAVAEPSDNIDGTLVVTVNAATATVGVLVPVPVLVPVLVPVPVPVVDDSPVMDFELPPHAASSTLPNNMTIDNLRILASLDRRIGGLNESISRDLTLHAEFLA
jgi:hypothetical protein